MGQDDPVPLPTVVLLHGQPDSSASFWALREELRHRLAPTIRIAVPDRPGYGVNTLSATDYPGNVAWLRSWIDKFDAGPVLVVGHSWAGGVAALAAADQEGPDWAALVLLASVGPGCLLWMDGVLAAPVIGELLSFLTLRLGRGAIVRQAISVLSRVTPASESPYAWASGAAMSTRPFWRSFLLEQRALVSQLPAIEAALPRIAVPTLVIAGSHDAVIPRHTGIALRDQILGATWRELDGGHDLQLRQPAAVAALIAEFAERVFEPGTKPS
jgi:pimeloyl-ACP methyl ester carboxylesterase